MLHTSKELHPNYYNDTFSTRNRHVTIKYHESTWLFHHGFGNVVKFQYELVSRRPSCLVGTVSDNHHSKKGKSVVVLKFYCETERGGGFHSVLTRKQRHLVLVSQFYSIWHINAFTISSTRGEPMVTLSTCSYKFPANWEKVFLFFLFFL